jgi:hypothetical protein
MDAPDPWQRLWRDVRPSDHHVIEDIELGQYAAEWLQDPAQAKARFPAVADHLADGCARCEHDLVELLDWLQYSGASALRNGTDGQDR